MLVLTLALLIAGLAIGLFVTRRPVAFGLSATLGIVATATVLVFSAYPWQLDRESIGVIALLVATVIGCWLGAAVQMRRLPDAGHIA